VRAFALSIVIVTLTTVAPALACSPIPCSDGETAPGNGRQLPSNAPVLVLVPSSESSGLTTIPDTSETSLILPDGSVRPLAWSPDPFDPMAYVPKAFVATPGALAPGHYVLRRIDRCDARSTADLAGATLDSAFDVVERSPLPTPLGPVTIATRVDTLRVGTGRGSCTVEIQAAIADVTLPPQPFASVTSYRLDVDGATWIIEHYGQVDPSPSDQVHAPLRATRIFAACDRFDGGQVDYRGL
jgi:hypothetical protein